MYTGISCYMPANGETVSIATPPVIEATISERLLKRTVTEMSGGRLHSSGGRLHSSGGLLHLSGGRLHSSGGRLHLSGGRLHSSSGRLHSSGGILHSSGGQLHLSSERLHSSGGLLHSSGGQLHLSSERLHSSGGLLHWSGGMSGGRLHSYKQLETGVLVSRVCPLSGVPISKRPYQRPNTANLHGVLVVRDDVSPSCNHLHTHPWTSHMHDIHRTVTSCSL